MVTETVVEKGQVGSVGDMGQGCNKGGVSVAWAKEQGLGLRPGREKLSTLVDHCLGKAYRGSWVEYRDEKRVKVVRWVQVVKGVLMCTV